MLDHREAQIRRRRALIYMFLVILLFLLKIEVHANYKGPDSKQGVLHHPLLTDCSSSSHWLIVLFSAVRPGKVIDGTEALYWEIGREQGHFIDSVIYNLSARLKMLVGSLRGWASHYHLFLSKVRARPPSPKENLNID